MQTNKKLIFIIILVLNINFIYCQNKRTMSKLDTLFGKNHFFFSLGLFSSKGNSRTINGNQNLTPALGLGHQIQIGYDVNYNKKYSLRLTAEIGQLPLNFTYDLTKKQYPILYDDHIPLPSGGFSDAGIPFVSFSSLFVNRFYVRKKSFLDIAVGLSLRYTPEGDFYLREGWADNAQNPITVFQMQTDDNSFKETLQVCPQISLGYYWILKNNNFLGFRFLYNLSFQNHIQLSYTFFPEPQHKNISSEGVLSQRGSYLGLNIFYCFTKNKKR